MKTEKEDWAKIHWLASYPKSGNTWIRCLLEAYFLGDVDINNMVCSGGDDHVFWQFPDNANLMLEAPDAIRLLERTFGLVHQVEAYMLAKHDIPMVVKTHSAFINLDGQDMYPPTLSKSYTYVVRDPRTVLPSFAAHFNMSLDEAIDKMLERGRMLVKKQKDRTPLPMTSWGMNVETFLKQKDEKNVLVIKYEDLKVDTIKWFRAYLEHLGVEIDVNMLENAVEKTKVSRLNKQEKEKGFCEKPDHTKEDFFGGKREVPTEAQLDKLVDGCKEQMMVFNYI